MEVRIKFSADIVIEGADINRGKKQVGRNTALLTRGRAESGRIL